MAARVLGPMIRVVRLHEAAFPILKPRLLIGVLTWFSYGESNELVTPCFIPDEEPFRVYVHETLFVQLPRTPDYRGVRILNLQTDPAGNLEVAMRVYDRMLGCPISYATYARLDGKAIDWNKRPELTQQPIPMIHMKGNHVLEPS